MASVYCICTTQLHFHSVRLLLLPVMAHESGMRFPLCNKAVKNLKVIWAVPMPLAPRWACFSPFSMSWLADIVFTYCFDLSVPSSSVPETPWDWNWYSTKLRAQNCNFNWWESQGLWATHTFSLSLLLVLVLVMQLLFCRHIVDLQCCINSPVQKVIVKDIPNSFSYSFQLWFITEYWRAGLLFAHSV